MTLDILLMITPSKYVSLSKPVVLKVVDIGPLVSIGLSKG